MNAPGLGESTSAGDERESLAADGGRVMEVARSVMSHIVDADLVSRRDVGVFAGHNREEVNRPPLLTSSIRLPASGVGRGRPASMRRRSRDHRE